MLIRLLFLLCLSESIFILLLVAYQNLSTAQWNRILVLLWMRWKLMLSEAAVAFIEFYLTMWRFKRFFIINLNIGVGLYLLVHLCFIFLYLVKQRHVYVKVSGIFIRAILKIWNSCILNCIFKSLATFDKSYIV